MCVGSSLLQRESGKRLLLCEKHVCKAKSIVLSLDEFYSFYDFEGTSYVKKYGTISFTWRRSVVNTTPGVKGMPKKITIIAYEVSGYLSSKCSFLNANRVKAANEPVNLPFLTLLPQAESGSLGKFHYIFYLTREITAEVTATNVQCKCEV